MKNTELEIVHANNIASIIINTEPHELKYKIEVYNNEVHGFKDLIQASKANADLCISLEMERRNMRDLLKKEVSKETSDFMECEVEKLKVKKLESERRCVNNNKGIDAAQQFFFVMFGLFLLFGSIMFVVGIYKTLSQ